MPPKIIAWVSRHPPLPAQIKTLQEKLGDIKLVQVTNTYQNYEDVIRLVKSYETTHAVVVLPLSIIARILDSKEAQGITWLRAQMQPAHEGACINGYKETRSNSNETVMQVVHQCGMFNPDTDVLMGERHLRFKEFQVLKSIELVTEPFMGVNHI